MYLYRYYENLSRTSGVRAENAVLKIIWREEETKIQLCVWKITIIKRLWAEKKNEIIGRFLLFARTRVSEIRLQNVVSRRPAPREYINIVRNACDDNYWQRRPLRRRYSKAAALLVQHGKTVVAVSSAALRSLAQARRDKTSRTKPFTNYGVIEAGARLENALREKQWTLWSNL